MSEEAGISIVDAGTGDVFADEALDFEVINGTFRIRFGVVKPARPSMPSERQMVHIGRLIMPLESAQRMAVGIYNMLKNAGLDPANLSNPSDQPMN